MITKRIVLALAALLMTVVTPAARAAPAAGTTITEQCSPNGTCGNFWGGGYALSTYQGAAGNNAIAIQSIPPLGWFQLIDKVHGGCVGDNGGGQGASRAGGGNTCNSTVTGGGGGWGTRFERITDALCPSGYFKYWNGHWQGYFGLPAGNGHPVYLNTTGTCIKQVAAVIG